MHCLPRSLQYDLCLDRTDPVSVAHTDGYSKPDAFPVSGADSDAKPDAHTVSHTDPCSYTSAVGTVRLGESSASAERLLAYGAFL